MLFDLAGWLALIAISRYWILQFVLPRRYDGGWRIAALVPLAVMVPIVLYTAFAFAAGSNLWPLLPIFVTPLGFYLIVVAAAKSLAT
jgi:hypothetical protein